MDDLDQAGFIDGVPHPKCLSVLVKDYVQNLDRFFDEGTGAVREGTRDDETPGFLFSEVTGYAIRDLLLLHALTGDAVYLTRAEKAATWLTQQAWHRSGWILTRYYFEQDTDENLWLYSFTGGNVFPFDNGICLGGLAAFCQTRPHAELLERTKALADNLVGIIQQDGSVSAVIDADGNVVPIERPRWSQHSGSFHAKIAEALVDFARIVPDKRYIDAARQICEFALEFQEADGRFITGNSGRTQLHPHCYAAEGLLSVGMALAEDQNRFIDSARRATEWALRQCVTGKIPQEVGPEGPVGQFYRTDALAQVLSLGSHLQQAGYLEERWWQPLNDLANSVWSMKDPQEGYFRYGTYEDGQESTTLSYWANMFAFHSLLEYVAAWVSKSTSVVVLAGGIGSRCWPISCENMPKPLSRGFLGDRSMLEETVSRFLHTGCVLPDNLFVVVGTNGLEEARNQMKASRIPDRNIIEELDPNGTLPALRLALKPLANRDNDILVVSMADNLIKPPAAFRDALARAVLATWWSEQGIVVSLGVPNVQPDPRFGHAVYNIGQEILPSVYRVNRFIEKPTSLPSMGENEAFAWDSGCIVSRVSYISEHLERPMKTSDRKRPDISYQLLENPEVRKGVSLYSPIVRFVDLGSPGKDLLRFFMGTKADRGNGNVFLGPEDVEVVFLKARQNIVISDKLTVEVVGLNSHLIIDNSFSNSAVLLPMTKAGELPKLYRMSRSHQDLQPYIHGGKSAWTASSHHMADECEGLCSVNSSHGLALAVYCRDVRLERTADRLRVVDSSWNQLTNADVDILLRKVADPRLVRHLLDVTTIAQILAEPVGLPQEAQEVLRLFGLTHDIGGFLTDEELATERELEAYLKQTSGLDWVDVDPLVIRKLIRTAPNITLTPKQQRLLDKFNDSANSALEVLSIDQIRSHPHLDELLFLLCNQERRTAFQRPLRSQLRLCQRPWRSQFKLTDEDLVKILSCFIAAETWVNTHSIWKRQLRPRPEEDIGRCMALICQFLSEANSEPAAFVRHVNQLMLDEHSPLYKYTREELRLAMKGAGQVGPVPLYGSDRVYLAFMRCVQENRSLDDNVFAAINATLENGQRFEQELLFWLPSHIKNLVDIEVVNAEMLESLALETLERFYHRRHDLWESLKEPRSSLLEILKSD